MQNNSLLIIEPNSMVFIDSFQACLLFAIKSCNMHFIFETSNQFQYKQMFNVYLKKHVE